MLKKLVSALALTSLAFGSGLCFNPYNHDYGVGLKGLGFGWRNKTIILHNGKMHVSKRLYVKNIKLIKYIAKNNNVLVLMNASMHANAPSMYGGYIYFVVYTHCTHGKPVMDDLEVLGDPGSQSGVVNIPRYPIKLGFYKDGFWVKALNITWVRHFSCNSSGCGPGGYSCDYETNYYPYKLVKEHKGYDGPFKDQDLPTRLCQVLGKKYGP